VDLITDFHWLKKWIIITRDVEPMRIYFEKRHYEAMSIDELRDIGRGYDHSLELKTGLPFLVMHKNSLINFILKIDLRERLREQKDKFYFLEFAEFTRYTEQIGQHPTHFLDSLIQKNKDYLTKYH
jgi:hypothetical protein